MQMIFFSILDLLAQLASVKSRMYMLENLS